MSKLIYLCSRTGAGLAYDARDMERVLARLAPDNLTPRPPRIIEGEGTLIGIFNPVDGLPVQGGSVCLGALFGHREDWWRPGAEVPDGSYALFRGDGETLELVSDIVASRTIWYAQTEDLFIAATSQRAIVCFLKSFEPNEAVYPWMLSSGTLGPGLSWDRRIRCLGPDARLRLDRRSWQIRIEQTPVEFRPEDLPRAEHERRLREALEATFARLELDPKRWVLPLSGGYDSRAILLFLKNRTGLKTVTWGLKSALADKESDAGVARELARHFGLAHEYYETDLSDEAVEKVLDRFLVAGEGRTDHISGYMDGFAVWKRLHESGCQGVLRGDEAFGWRSVTTPSGVINRIGITRLSDYGNLRHSDMQGLNEQILPDMFQQTDEETLSQWRDRLYQIYRVPYILAALNDLKCAYVEIANPFLARTVIGLVRKLPDSYRTEKRLFKSIVDSSNTLVAYAEHPAIESQANILRNPVFIGLIMTGLHEDHTGRILPAKLLGYLQFEVARAAGPHAQASSAARRLKARIKQILPDGMTAAIKSTLAHLQGRSTAAEIDANRLAFRAYIICRMNAFLSRDAELLNPP